MRSIVKYIHEQEVPVIRGAIQDNPKDNIISLVTDIKNNLVRGVKNINNTVQSVSNTNQKSIGHAISGVRM